MPLTIIWFFITIFVLICFVPSQTIAFIVKIWRLCSLLFGITEVLLLQVTFWFRHTCFIICKQRAVQLYSINNKTSVFDFVWVVLLAALKQTSFRFCSLIVLHVILLLSYTKILPSFQSSLIYIISYVDHNTLQI